MARTRPAGAPRDASQPASGARTFTLRAWGSSMWPVLWPGARLEVEACGANALARGDVAVLIGRGGQVVAHRVMGRTPDGRVRTAGDGLGREDAPWAPQSVLGRARAVRQLGVRVGLDGLAARAVGHALTTRVARSALAKVRRTRGALSRALQRAARGR